METINYIKLLTWNCLTSRFGSPDAFPRVNPELLEWKNRAVKIKNNLALNDADIMCLVEIDNPDYYKNEIFNYKKEGELQMIYAERRDHVMGVLFCFKTEKFSLLTQDIFYIMSKEGSEDHPVLYVQLEEKATKKKFSFLLTHLKAKAWNANIREKQIEQITQYIKYRDLLSEPLIFTGDFNLEPTTDNYKQIQKIGLTSVFEFFDKTKNNYIEFSSCKYRDKLYKYTIDYILYNEAKIENKGFYLPKEKDSVDFEIGLPNEVFPSDHFYLVYEFSIK